MQGWVVGRLKPRVKILSLQASTRHSHSRPFLVSSGRPSCGLWQGSTAAPLSGGRRVVWQSPWSFDTHVIPGCAYLEDAGVACAQGDQSCGGPIWSMRVFTHTAALPGPCDRGAAAGSEPFADPGAFPPAGHALASRLLGERTRRAARGGSWASPQVARGASAPTPLALTRHVATPTARDSGSWGWPGARRGGRAAFAVDSPQTLTGPARSPHPKTAGPGFQPPAQTEPGGLGARSPGARSWAQLSDPSVRALEGKVTSAVEGARGW